MKNKLLYILFIFVILFGFSVSVKAASGRGEYEKDCSYDANINLPGNYKNNIHVEGNSCRMRVAVYGDMGAAEYKYEDCPADLASWIKNKDECPPNFEFDPNANYDLDTSDDEVNYEGRTEYQEELEREQREQNEQNDNSGKEVYDCKGLIGPNTLAFLKMVLNIIMIAGPMLAVVLGSYDLVVAMANGEEDAKKKGIKKFKNRLIAAGILLLLPAIVELLLNFFGKGDSNCLENLENLTIWKF